MKGQVEGGFVCLFVCLVWWLVAFACMHLQFAFASANELSRILLLFSFLVFPSIDGSINHLI